MFFRIALLLCFAGFVGLLWELRRILLGISQQLQGMAQLVAEGRARQTSVRRSSGGPKQERAKQQGPRHSGTRGARQVQALKRRRVGGDYIDRDDEGDRLQSPG